MASWVYVELNIRIITKKFIDTTIFWNKVSFYLSSLAFLRWLEDFLQILWIWFIPFIPELQFYLLCKQSGAGLKCLLNEIQSRTCKCTEWNNTETSYEDIFKWTISRLLENTLYETHSDSPLMLFSRLNFLLFFSVKWIKKESSPCFMFQDNAGQTFAFLTCTMRSK